MLNFIIDHYFSFKSLIQSLASVQAYFTPFDPYNVSFINLERKAEVSPNCERDLNSFWLRIVKNFNISFRLGDSSLELDVSDLANLVNYS